MCIVAARLHVRFEQNCRGGYLAKGHLEINIKINIEINMQINMENQSTNQSENQSGQTSKSSKKILITINMGKINLTESIYIDCNQYRIPRGGPVFLWLGVVSDKDV